MGTLAPEVKRLTLSQRLNGKNGHQSCLPCQGFCYFFFLWCVTQCHAICQLFYPGGLTYERGGDACRKFCIKPLKEITTLVEADLFWPLKETISLQRSFVIGVIEDFDYMNWVSKWNGRRRASPPLSYGSPPGIQFCHIKLFWAYPAAWLDKNQL